MPAIKLINSERLNLEKRHKKEHERKFADRIKSILFLDEGWSKDKEIRSNTGRQRVNINGALCYHTMNVVCREDSTIDRFSSLNLLKQIWAAHDASTPITVVLDNARYNKVSEVSEYAATNNIKLMLLPPYSPNLNLIERLWRFFKGEVCTKYYEKFKQFKDAALEFFDNMTI